MIRKEIFVKSSTKLIATNSDTDEAFKSMHQSVMTKIEYLLVNIGLPSCNYKA